MSLKIEFTKNGKPNVLFNNNKYRESYSLKSGEIIWRCLGRNCGATIKSNSERTTVTTVNCKHSDPHPVTMRALTSPRMSSSLPATPPAAETTMPRSSTTPSPTHPRSPIEALTQTATSGYPSPATLVTISCCIIARCRLGLCPSSEFKWSDARLLQFTDQLFVANLSTIKTPGGRTADCAVQCDLSSSTACQDPRCSEIRNLVASLKTTVEVLEAELECFKAETVKKSKTRSDSENEGGWWYKINQKEIKKVITRCISRVTAMSVICGLVRQCVSPSTRVGGTCRPGAKLLTVTDNGLPPPGSCYVLFAGTNDVAADESYTIFEHLERQLTARLSSSAVIVSTRIALVNFYIEELSVRYKGIEVLNFNEIGRRWFTQHGMHLRLPGKRLPAELLLECLDRFGQSPTIRPPTSPAHAASSTPLSSLPVQDRQQLSSEALSPTAVQPVELHRDQFALVPSPAGAMTRPGNKTFAEAVNSCSPATSSPLDEIQLMCAEMKTDVLVLTENGFNDKNIDLCKIPNFTLANSYCRQLSKGGGVGIFVRKNYTFSPFSPIKTIEKDFEAVGIKFNSNRSKLTVIGIYRSPNGNEENFFTHFEALLMDLTSHQQDYVLMGDFINAMDTNHPSIKRFVDLLSGLPVPGCVREWLPVDWWSCDALAMCIRREWLPVDWRSCDALVTRIYTHITQWLPVDWRSCDALVTRIYTHITRNDDAGARMMQAMCIRREWLPVDWRSCDALAMCIRREWLPVDWRSCDALVTRIYTHITRNDDAGARMMQAMCIRREWLPVDWRSCDALVSRIYTHITRNGCHKLHIVTLNGY
ncbi:hypothetical protein J6590_058433 [Homalodisca vitripennis]|nr:hypothetical protein J6590_058433 [Homalodisca vitripennis]